MMRTFILVLTVSATSGLAQWLNYPAAGIPRLPDGKPNPSANQEIEAFATKPSIRAGLNTEDKAP